ncbi:MAG: dTMP kinase, partial [Deltaproteobacteria bacterium]|nr:dTMP kinase [Deltaproteobacteria bacterium]
KKIDTYGIPLVKTFEPGGTRVGEGLRRILLDSQNKNLSPVTELMLYAADRAQHVEEVIKPALDQGKWVICDRFFDATVAYQGSARGQDIRLIQFLNEKVTQGIRPDMTFLLDCPVEMGLDRAIERDKRHSHKGQDRFEMEKVDFHLEVKRAYLELARENQKRFVVIDATLAEDDVEEKMFQYLKPFLVSYG